jgi:alkylation response protein AidB-like acyl-CoA dehydrogenase
MDLSLDESERILQRTFAEFFSGQCPIASVRAAQLAGGFDATLWQAFCELEALGMTLPETAGGLGLDLLSACLIAEEAGRVLAPIPVCESIAALQLANDSGLDTTWVNAAIAGEITLGLVEKRAGDSQLIGFGAVADYVLLYRENAVYLLDAKSARAESALSTLDHGAHAMWHTAGDATLLSEGGAADKAWRSALATHRLLQAAALTGLAQQALAIGVDYAKTREQFGNAIGAFQAIAHPLADVAMDVDGAQLLCWEAAWAAQNDVARFEELAAMALVFAAQTAQESAAVSLHTHGGYGFTEEYDIQLYYRQASSRAMLLGGVAETLLAVSELRRQRQIQEGA